MAKKNKFPADKSGSEMLYREARFDLARANDDERSIPIILATEDPITTVDMQRREIVNEVLRIDGLELPQSGRIPMLDSHNRETVRNVLGSIRDFEKTNGTLRAVAYFSEDAADIYRGYRDGHLEDFSVGAPILEREYKPGKNASERTLKTVTKSV
ncbi:MAG TPA: hypothetical protein VLA12_15085, partial [Planctomycetaceae bacterium]|nr:hypothetical protein [Planctomycetaceae bacterium]